MRRGVVDRALEHMPPHDGWDREQQGDPELVAEHRDAVARVLVVSRMVRVPARCVRVRRLSQLGILGVPRLGRRGLVLLVVLVPVMMMPLPGMPSMGIAHTLVTVGDRRAGRLVLALAPVSERVAEPARPGASSHAARYGGADALPVGSSLGAWRAALARVPA